MTGKMIINRKNMRRKTRKKKRNGKVEFVTEGRTEKVKNMSTNKRKRD